MFQKLSALTIIVITVITLAKGEDFITRTGVIFTYEKEVYDLQNTWTISVTHSIQPLLQAVDQLQVTSQKIQKFIDDIGKLDDYPIRREADEVNFQVKVTQNIANEIKRLIKAGRTKRGLINFGGKAYQWLFGLATEDDVQAIADRLESIETQHNSTAHNLIEQISILNQTSERSFRNEQRIDKLEEASTFLAKTLDLMTKTMAEEKNQTMLLNQLYTNFRMFAVHILDVKFELLEFLSAFESLYNGKISAYFFEPSAFHSVLDKIATMLPREVSLFYPIGYAEIYKYYTFSHTSAIMSKNGDILFLVQIPLKEEHSVFHTYKLNELPTKIGNSNLEIYKFLNIDSKYLAISQDEKQFFTFDSFEELKCEDWDIPVSVCKIDEPVRSVKQPICSVALLFNKTNWVNKLCEFKILQSPFVIIHKIDRNKYFYAVSEKNEVDWECPGSKVNDYVKEILGYGTLEIPSLCTAKIGPYTLRGKFSGQINGHSQWVHAPHFTFVEHHPELLQAFDNSTDTALMIQNILNRPNEVNKDQLQTRMKLQELVEEIKSSMEKKKAHAHHYGTIGGIGVTFAFTSILGILFWCFRRNILSQVLKLSATLIPKAANNFIQNTPPTLPATPALQNPIQNPPLTLSPIIVPVQTPLPALTYPITQSTPDNQASPDNQATSVEIQSSDATPVGNDEIDDERQNDSFVRRNTLGKRSFRDILFKRYKF